MERNMADTLCLIIPKEKHNYIADIVRNVLQEQIIVDDMLVSEYEQAIEERDNLAEKLRSISTDLATENVNLKDRLNLCEHDKNIIVNELNERTKNVAQKYDEMLSALKNLVSEEDFKSFIKDFTDSEIAMYNLEKFKEEKYKIIELEVTKEIKKNIRVLVKENETVKDAIEVLEEYEGTSNLDDCIEDSKDIEYSYVEVENTDFDSFDDAEEHIYTKEQVLRHREQYWCNDDVMREIYE